MKLERLKPGEELVVESMYHTARIRCNEEGFLLTQLDCHDVETMLLRTWVHNNPNRNCAEEGWEVRNPSLRKYDQVIWRRKRQR